MRASRFKAVGDNVQKYPGKKKKSSGWILYRIRPDRYEDFLKVDRSRWYPWKLYAEFMDNGNQWRVYYQKFCDLDGAMQFLECMNRKDTFYEFKLSEEKYRDSAQVDAVGQ